MNIYLNDFKQQNKSFDAKKFKLAYHTRKELDQISGKFFAFQFNDKVVDMFIDFLGLDAVLLLRLMHINASKFVVNELVSQLFFEYIQKYLR